VARKATPLGIVTSLVATYLVRLQAGLNAGLRQRLVAPAALGIHPRLLVEKREGDHCGILVFTRAVAVLDYDLVEELGDIVYVQDLAVGG
jgi:hypothetical protein